jgi:hypothetical protein
MRNFVIKKVLPHILSIISVCFITQIVIIPFVILSGCNYFKSLNDFVMTAILLVFLVIAIIVSFFVYTRVLKSLKLILLHGKEEK